MNVYLLRHGEVNNPKKVLYGRLPGFHLTETGKKHISKVADLFCDSDIKEIYCSPLERTVETSRIVAEKLSITTDHIHIKQNLIDTDCKKWTGIPESQYLLIPQNYKDIESSEEIIARAFPEIDKIAKTGNDSIVVTHADVIMALIAIITNDYSSIGTYADKFIAKGSFVKIVFNNNKWQRLPQNTL